MTVTGMSNPGPPPLQPDTPPPAGTSILAALLSLVVLLFAGSTVLAFLDDSLLLFAGRQDLTPVRALSLLIMLLAGFVTYLLMTVFPGIPKRVFLTISLFLPVSCVAVLPLLVYFHEHAALIGWCVSLVQVVVTLAIVRHLQGALKFTWPVVADQHLSGHGSGWRNFAGMTLGGLFVLLPALALYIAFSARLAVDHFTDGFVALRPSGVSVEVRKYLRDDGKAVTLVPMSHIGEPDFYQDLSASFPADSVVLMEGVTDSKNVVTTRSNYSRMADTIGVVEQHEAFKPKGELVAADMDMSEFSPATLAMLKTAMLIHSKGVTAETLPHLLKPTPPGLEKQLMADILTKRNRHLLKVLHERLPASANIIVPWGAAHMPEISREIQKSGFRMVEAREYMAIRFGS